MPSASRQSAAPDFDEAARLPCFATLMPAAAMKGHVCRDVNDADVLVGQHHGILLRIGEGGINFRMSVEVMACQVQRLFVQRCCHGAVHFVGHRQFNGLPDVLEGCIAALGLYLSELEAADVDTLHVEDINSSILEAGVLNAADSVDLQVEAQQLYGLLHNGSVARHYRTAFLVSFLTVQGVHRYLRSYACRVAHGDG